MYETFYGLTGKPFQLNPDPHFYFGSKQHRRAKAYLEYGVHQNEGFIVVTGEVGAGKTTLVRGLLDTLDAAKVVAANITSTQLEADDMLRLVAAAFGVRSRDVAKADLLLALEAALVEATRQGKRCLLIVDEAQNLTPRAVEELRMLSNFQFGNHALLQSFLIGQPEFREILQSPQLLQLRQRVIASCHIGPMEAADTRGYVEHRLRCAGARDKPNFDDAAFVAIHDASGGIPRRINAVCDRLLLMGFLSGKTAIAAADVAEVAHELAEETRAGGAAQPLAEVAADAARPRLDTGRADEAARLLAEISAGQFDERLLRIERSLLRAERLNSATLVLLQQLVDVLRQPSVRGDDH